MTPAAATGTFASGQRHRSRQPSESKWRRAALDRKKFQRGWPREHAEADSVSCQRRPPQLSPHANHTGGCLQPHRRLPTAGQRRSPLLPTLGLPCLTLLTPPRQFPEAGADVGAQISHAQEHGRAAAAAAAQRASRLVPCHPRPQTRPPAQVQSLVEHERIVTTEPKAKELKRVGDQVVGWAKKWARAQQLAADYQSKGGATTACRPRLQRVYDHGCRPTLTCPSAHRFDRAGEAGGRERAA